MRTAKKKATVDPVTAYARAVDAGEIPASRWHVAACRRHLRDLERADLVWNPEIERGRGAGRRKVRAVDHGIGWYRDVLKLGGGKFHGRPFILEPFQIFMTGSLLGWYLPDGRRRYTTAYIETPKGSGKSPWAAGLMLLLALADEEPVAQVFFAAAKMDQARLAFDHAVRMRAQAPALSARLACSGRNPVWQLTDTTTGSFLKPVASDDAQSGRAVKGACIDEIHEHADDVVVGMMKAATKNIEDPLIIMITNSGSDRTSVCWQHHAQGEQILEGTVADDSHFVFMCGLTMQRQEKGDDGELRAPAPLQPDEIPAGVNPIAWLLEHEEVWPIANPAIGTILPFEYVRKQLTDAVGLPGRTNETLRLIFSVWTEAETVWIPDDVWMRCATDADLEEEMLGRRCYGGLDLGSTADLSAFVLLFPDDGAGGDGQAYTCLEWFFAPNGALMRRRKKDRVTYDTWRDQGFLVALPGEETNPSDVKDFIVELAKRYTIEAIGYDRAFGNQAVFDLTREGFEMVAQAQTHLGLGAALGDIQRRIVNGLLRHRGHPVMRWNMANVRIETRSELGRIDKDRSRERVDGAAALVNAANVAMRLNARSTGSAYDDPEHDIIEIEDAYF